jgi:hypothetical protein
MESSPPKSSSDDEKAPKRKCSDCGTAMAYVGELPPSGMKPGLRVFRCMECHLISSEPI